MGRSCGSGNSFSFEAGENTYQIYLVFSGYQRDIKSNPYLKDTQVQIRDSCSWPFKFPNDGKGNEYRFPNGRGQTYFGGSTQSAINGSDPYDRIILIPYEEQKNNGINPNTKQYYTVDELQELYPWTVGSKFDIFDPVDDRVSTSALYSWGKKIYNKLGEEETVNTVECDILYYSKNSNSFRKALVNRDYANTETGMYLRMQKRGNNPKYLNSNNIPPSFFIESDFEIGYKSNLSETYPFFKWFDYYENFNPRKKGYTYSTLQSYYIALANPNLSAWSTKVIFNFLSSPSFDIYYHDTNILPAYLLYRKKNISIEYIQKNKYIYIVHNISPKDDSDMLENTFQSDVTWPKSLNIKMNAKQGYIFDPNQNFSPSPNIPQDIVERYTAINNILNSGISLTTNEEYLNARYYKSSEKNYKYYKEYTVNGVSKKINEDLTFFIIHEPDSLFLGSEFTKEQRIKDRGGFIVLNFSNDTNQWEYVKGYWQLTNGSDYISTVSGRDSNGVYTEYDSSLTYHKNIVSVLGFDGTALGSKYLVVYDNNTKASLFIIRLIPQFLSGIDVYLGGEISFTGDGVESTSPSSEEFNPANFRKKLPKNISYKYEARFQDGGVQFYLDMKSSITDTTYRVPIYANAISIETE
jgi:hypothetical protein